MASESTTVRAANCIPMVIWNAASSLKCCSVGFCSVNLEAKNYPSGPSYPLFWGPSIEIPIFVKFPFFGSSIRLGCVYSKYFFHRATVQ